MARIGDCVEVEGSGDKALVEVEGSVEEAGEAVVEGVRVLEVVACSYTFN